MEPSLERKIADAYLAGGRTLKSLALEHGVTMSAVWRAVDRNRVPEDTEAYKELRLRAVELVLVGQLSVAESAEHCGLPYRRVQWLVNKAKRTGMMGVLGG